MSCHVIDYIQIRRKMYKWGKNFIYTTALTFMKLLPVHWYYPDMFHTPLVLPRYVPCPILPKSVKIYEKYGYKVI